MDVKKKIIVPIIHAAVWLLLLSFSFLLERNSPFHMPVSIKLGIIFTYALIFYITYFALMPLLLRKKQVLFVALSLLIIGVAFLGKQWTIQQQMDKVFEQERPAFINRPQDMEGPQKGYEGKLKPPKWSQQSFFSRMFNGRNLLDVSSLVLFYALGVSLRFIKKWQYDEEWKQALEKQKVTTELEYLKQQINPHFLFNSLNSIYSLALTNSEITTHSILKLSSILRYMLYESEDSMVMLQKELDTVKDYIDLHKLRLTELVDVQYKVTGVAGHHTIAPFVLIPLIENAFKYGTDTASPSFIHIQLDIGSDDIRLEVSNKIVRKVTNETSSGIGLKNIERRLELLYPSEHLLRTHVENEVYKVTLQLKLKQ